MAARICMIVYTDYAGDTRVRREAEALVARGDLVHVICPQPKERAHVTYLNGVTLVPRGRFEYGERGPLRYMAKYLRFLARAGATAFRYHRRHRYDVVQVHTMPDFLVFAALGAADDLDADALAPGGELVDRRGAEGVGCAQRDGEVLGDEDSVGSMTRADILRFFEAHYRPANLVVASAGRVDHDELCEAVSERLGGGAVSRSAAGAADLPTRGRIPGARRRCPRVYLDGILPRPARLGSARPRRAGGARAIRCARSRGRVMFLFRSCLTDCHFGAPRASPESRAAMPNRRNAALSARSGTGGASGFRAPLRGPGMTDRESAPKSKR